MHRRKESSRLFLENIVKKKIQRNENYDDSQKWHRGGTLDNSTRGATCISSPSSLPPSPAALSGLRGDGPAVCDGLDSALGGGGGAAGAAATPHGVRRAGRGDCDVTRGARGGDRGGVPDSGAGGVGIPLPHRAALGPTSSQMSVPKLNLREDA
eukprot:Hpha_TRINITY_DN13815_c0_g2::TRINITY_DN13815_c0_g2_i1::g.70133::m.70133